MYAMYDYATDSRHRPSEWGPAKHRSADERFHDGHDGAEAAEAVQAALDLRDNGGQRPDDN